MLYLGQNTERNKLFVSNFLEQNNGLITNNNRNRKIVKLNQKFITELEWGLDLGLGLDLIESIICI